MGALLNDMVFQFGDGIMSLIDCKVKVDKKPDAKGDRVVLTFECVPVSTMQQAAD